MEPFALYLIKSVTWLTGFFLVYILFLRNERFFVLNRIFLISGILASLLLPFLTFRYTVLLTAGGSAEAGDAVAAGVKSSSGSINAARCQVIADLSLSGWNYVCSFHDNKTVQTGYQGYKKKRPYLFLSC